MINKKLEVLKKIALLFNEHSITWNVGASCMLYLRGVVDTFCDIDLMVAIEDIPKVKKLLKTFYKDQKHPNDQYKTIVFLEYVIDFVEIDIMAGFTIVFDHKDYYFPLSKNSSSEVIYLDSCPIYVESIHKWLDYYKLMRREDKVLLIETYLNK